MKEAADKITGRNHNAGEPRCSIIQFDDPLYFWGNPMRHTDEIGK
ncbi:MAG TPA: hypothetical protein VKP59_03930 [Candidatus Thermoplasmatota archaeon]|nr:hypothetical protein [Candidatus Thermoplasmatota archaeon]